MLAGAGPALSRMLVGEAQAAALNLPLQLPEGTRREAVLDALPGKRGCGLLTSDAAMPADFPAL